MKALITALENEEPYELPSYSDPGRILVRSFGKAEPYDNGNASVYRWSTEVLDHDGSAFWIGEGEGFDYWLDQEDGLEAPGVYVIEGIKGHYVRGDWGFTEDSVDWEHAAIRPATPEEIEAEALMEIKA